MISEKSSAEATAPLLAILAQTVSENDTDGSSVVDTVAVVDESPDSVAGLPVNVDIAVESVGG